MKRNLLLLGLIIIKFVLQYSLVHPEYDLQRDEYLHLDQANHLAWGYISVPPVTSWIAYLIKLLGNGVFWVQFFPALFGALTIVVVWKTIEALNGNIYALLLGSLAILVSAILRINMLFQPNSLDIFFWTLVYFTVVKYIQTGKSAWLYAAAISLAFGFLSKYNIVFLVAGLVPAILLSEHRKVFQNKHLYFAAGIFVLMIAPNIAWQIQHNFPTIHQLKELQETQLVNVNRADFIKDQVLYFLSSIFVIIAAFTGFLFYPPFKKYRFFGWSFLFSICVFLLLKAKSYYAVGLYPILIAFGSVYLEKVFSTGWKLYLKPVSIVLLIGLSIPFILIVFPYESPEATRQNSQKYKGLGLLRWEDGKDHLLPQDFADMLGWRSLAKQVDSAYDSIENKNETLVLCDNYGQAGAINYYSAFKNINAVSFNADYINWIPLDKTFKNVIVVKEADDDDSSRTREIPLFDTVRLVGQNNHPYSREFGTKIFVLLGARADINKRIEDEMRAKKY